METLELRRVRAPEAEPTFDLLAALALKAEALLGYSGLCQKLGVQPGSLAQVLEELDIEPYRLEDVKRYKKEKARDTTARVQQQFYARAQRELDPTAYFGSYVRARWRKVPLSKYEGAVPEFVLSRAIEVKERVPNAEFTVEYLKVETQYDPFLIVSCGRAHFYIDVWDERDFEEQLVEG